MREYIRYLATASAMAAVAGTAHAAEAPAAAPEAASANTLGEIVVTARRRSESLSTVPVAVSAFSGEELQRRSVVDIRQIAQASPSTFVTSTTGSRNAPIIAIRGQYQTDNLISLDPAVGTYVDDVYLARPIGILSEMLDIGGVEVLKGPQGTLYGRNTTGGAFRLTTVKPDASKLSGYARVSVGNYKSVGVQAAVNVPLISDVLAARYAVTYNKHAGYTHSYLLARGRSLGNGVATNAPATDTPVAVIDTDNRDSLAQRLSVRLTPNDQLTIDVMGEVQEANDNGSAFYAQPGEVITAVTTNGPGAVATAFSVSPEHQADFYSLRTDAYPLSKMLTRMFRASAEYEVSDDLTAKLIYGYRWARGSSALNNEGSVLSAAVANAGANFVSGASANGTHITQQGAQNSLEGQLLGKALDGKVNWILGGFWFRETGYDYQNQVPVQTTTNPPSYFPGDAGSQPRRGDGLNKSWSVFGNVDVAVTDKLSLTGGLRYTKDSKTLTVENRTGLATATIPAGTCLFSAAPTVNLANGACALTTTTDSSFVSFLANVSYKVSPDLFVYAKVSNGYRSGGGQPRATDNTTAGPFTAEKVLDFEAGFKAKLFDRRASLNVAAFRTHRKNIQYSTVVTAPAATGTTRTTFISNAGNGNYTGIEAELKVALGAGFSVQASASYFEEDRTLADRKVAVSAAVPTGILKDQVIANQKPFFGSASLVYDNTFGFGDVNARFDVVRVPRYYSSAYASDVTASPFATLPAYTLANARAGVILENGLSLSVYGKNIFNKKYFRSMLITGNQYPASFGDPRTYGVELGFKF